MHVSVCRVRGTVTFAWHDDEPLFEAPCPTALPRYPIECGEPAANADHEVA